MATQDMHVQDKIINEANPQSLYELLIYDNQKLESKSGEPHIILRRTLKGHKDQIVEMLTSQSDPDEASETEKEQEPSIVDSIASPQQQSVEPEEEAIDEDVQEDFVAASTISSYLASLSNHVQSDVLRVVDAIIELEKTDKVENGITKSDENQQSDVSRADQEESVQEETNKHLVNDPAPRENKNRVRKLGSDLRAKENKKKGIDIADIFKSLKKARKKAQQKSYSYTKKVEYEDH